MVRKRLFMFSLVALFLIVSKSYAGSGWETTGKVLTGVITGDIIKDIPHCHHKCCCKEEYKETYQSYLNTYRVWIPAHWEKKTVHDIIPEGYQTIKVYKEDGSYYYVEKYIPPTIIERTIKIWVEGHWEYKTNRY
ncbi:MAG TPA: hypothetical protein PLW95_02960 [bacterium]|nr:hypothetical protein [bacterium]